MIARIIETFFSKLSPALVLLKTLFRSDIQNDRFPSELYQREDLLRIFKTLSILKLMKRFQSNPF